MNTIEQDILYRFLINNKNVRGEIARLNDSFELAINTHKYPFIIQKLLGEMMAATALLTASLKFKGQITIQLQGNDNLKLVVVNGNHNQQLRALARYSSNIDDKNDVDFVNLIGKGILAITISPEQGEKYQGIVDLDKPTLAECLENYFFQSEQLPTQIILKSGIYNNRPIATGMLLQIIPNTEQTTDENFTELSLLTATISEKELFSLKISDILYRLYHQQQVEIFKPQQISFKCGCSRDKTERALMLLAEDEIQEIISDDQGLEMLCDYCNVNYAFTTSDVATLLKNKKGDVNC